MKKVFIIMIEFLVVMVRMFVYEIVFGYIFLRLVFIEFIILNFCRELRFGGVVFLLINFFVLFNKIEVLYFCNVI